MKAVGLGLPQERALALAALRIVDAANEWIYSRLDRDNTIWIQTSDNGGEPHKGASNYPLRGGKGSGWQGGTQVPCFMWLGANLRGSLKSYEGLVHVTDWVPTLVGGALGAPEALPDDLYGQDLWESLRGNSEKKREDILLLATAGTGDDAGEAMVSLRTDRYKVLIGQAPCAPTSRTASPRTGTCTSSRPSAPATTRRAPRPTSRPSAPTTTCCTTAPGSPRTSPTRRATRRTCPNPRTSTGSRGRPTFV